jgi:hypothetical protein
MRIQHTVFRKWRVDPPAPATALDFNTNATAGSDVQLAWLGANLLSRTSHTALCRVRWKPQVGYYSLFWHTDYDNWDGGIWSFGAHPYPTDGTIDGNGMSTGGTGGSGTVQYQEMAAVGAPNDKIAVPMSAFKINDPGDPTSPAQAGTWLVMAKSCEVISGGTQLRHRVWPNVLGGNNYIEHILAIGDIGADPPTPSFLIGASPWRTNQPSAGQNDETPSCYARGIRLFNAPLVYADMLTEANAIGSNAPATSAGSSSVWYINDNPTHTDITDKSGAGHTPVWKNANRPATVVV